MYARPAARKRLASSYSLFTLNCRSGGTRNNTLLVIVDDERVCVCKFVHARVDGLEWFFEDCRRSST